MRARRGYVVTAGQLLPLFLEGKAHAAPPHSAEDHRVLVSNQKGIRGTERTHTHTQTNDSSRLNMNASTRRPGSQQETLSHAARMAGPPASRRDAAVGGRICLFVVNLKCGHEEETEACDNGEIFQQSCIVKTSSSYFYRSCKYFSLINKPALKLRSKVHPVF